MEASAQDHRLAQELASEAGELLLAVREELSDAEAQQRKDEGDRRSHEFLMHHLGEARPDDAILSEEGKDDLARLESSRVWIVDPLDGTREFSELGRSDWAVHVALAIDGVPVVGAVALPALGVTMSTAQPPELGSKPEHPPRVIASRTRPGPAAEAVSKSLGAELVFMGSAGAKAMAVVRGEAEIYAHTGGQFEWDNCAPAAVAMAAGLHASRLDGSALTYNHQDPYLPDLLICRVELAEAALAAVAHLGG